MEFDNSKFSEIGKFNYVRERLEGEPKGHILGLPQTSSIGQSIVLQYDVKAKYRLISRKFSGMKFFHPGIR